MQNPGTALAPLTEVERQLAEVETPEEAKELYDKLEALSQYAKRYRVAHEQQNEIAEAKLKTARKGGRLLDEHLGTGPRGGSGNATLPEGMSKMQSSRWQALARIPAPEFSRLITETKERGDELTLAGALRFAKRLNAPPSDPPEAPPDTYRVIVADPPWQYGNKATRGAAETHYSTMTIPALCELADETGRPVSEWAAPDAHLYLWTTTGFLREAFEVMEAWEFTYKTNLVWAKPQMGLGNYFRVNHEHVLFGTRGSLPIAERDIETVFTAPRTQHSRKPDLFYDLVEKASPGPYLEMFARRKRLGWDSWGAEA